MSNWAVIAGSILANDRWVAADIEFCSAADFKLARFCVVA